MDAPSQEVFKAGLDGGLSSLIQWKVTLSTVEGLELDNLKGSFQSMLFYESLILLFYDSITFLEVYYILYFCTCCTVNEGYILKKIQNSNLISYLEGES